jgi:hypothetical protein
VVRDLSIQIVGQPAAGRQRLRVARPQQQRVPRILTGPDGSDHPNGDFGVALFAERRPMVNRTGTRPSTP